MDGKDSLPMAIVVMIILDILGLFLGLQFRSLHMTLEQVPAAGLHEAVYGAGG